MSLITLALLTTASAENLSPVKVGWLEDTSQIDGQISEAESRLPLQPFRRRFTFDNPVIKTADVAFRLGYNADHLYLAIETKADKIRYHNRGFLWGDGWRILLSKTSPLARSENYIDIYASPKPSDDSAVEAFVAVQDNQQVFKRFRGDSKVAEQIADGKAIFEARIAWTDLRPYRPDMDGKMGVNIYFAKGLENAKGEPFAYGYALVGDEGIWDEEIQHRAYVPLHFGPAPKDKALFRPHLDRRTIAAGTAIQLKVHPNSNNVRVSLKPQNGHSIPLTMDNQSQISTTGINPGNYSLQIEDADSSYTESLVILPSMRTDQYRAMLEDTKLSVGTRDTLTFRLQNLEQRILGLKPHEAPDDLVRQVEELKQDFEKVAAGIDVLANAKGVYRRAFQSQLDGSYQPYSVRTPDPVDKDKLYPGLIFLHGSGTDDKNLLDRGRGDGNFIEIAPFGRTKYRVYAEQASQIDIAEAINAAARDLPIDKGRLVIGGFSMGGYGALRTFYEYPKMFKGVAVFAGHPDLANEWLDGTHPNFLDPEYAKVFKDIPVFIYHGRRDASLAFEKAEKLANILRSVGAKVTFSISDENGHEYQDEVTQERYRNWLAQF